MSSGDRPDRDLEADEELEKLRCSRSTLELDEVSRGARIRKWTSHFRIRKRMSLWSTPAVV